MDAITRPPRDDQYTERNLVGGSRATFALSHQGMPKQKYYREDMMLENRRGESLSCSHYRPCVVHSDDGAAPCVIYCHANSGSRRDAEEIVYSLLPYSISVFAMDFSGSGKSGGAWVTLGANEVDDLDVVVEYLRKSQHVSTIGLWGRSMGAVTALMYSYRDPSIAVVVADSPFSNLVELMVELATNKEQGMAIPKPVVKVLLTFMRRSIRKRAGFRIDDVSPIDMMPKTYVPTLFGHGKDDTFIPLHHSERLFVAHGSDMKHFVAFEGDHNGVRPSYWYDNGMTFMLSGLHGSAAVPPQICTSIPAAAVEEEEEEDHDDDGHHTEEEEEEEEEDEDAVVQRVLEMSLAEDNASRRREALEEEQQLEQALKASLQECMQTGTQEQGPSTCLSER